MVGKNLVKTGKVIKVDPMDVTNLYRFVKRYIRWEPRDYLNELDKRFPFRFGSSVVAKIPLDVVILPSYMVLEVPQALANVITPKQSDIILPENFSYFDLYKVVDDPSGEITNTVIEVTVNYRIFEDDAARIRNILLMVEHLHSSRSDETLYISTTLDKGFTVEGALTKALNSLRWARGKSYSSFSSVNSRLIRKLLMIEGNITLFLNFLYALHTHNFDGTDMASWLFKHYSDLVKGFGCEFEDVLLSVKTISAFLL